MSNAWKRKLLAAALALSAGTVFQYLPHGCANYGVAQALSAFDFCAVLNCQGGSFIDLCQPIALLTDCPATTTTQ
jgi:hypothetical protein